MAGRLAHLQDGLAGEDAGPAGEAQAERGQLDELGGHFCARRKRQRRFVRARARGGLVRTSSSARAGPRAAPRRAAPRART